MKKIILSILTMGTIGASAQIPANDFARYEFTNGSLMNTSSSGAGNLVGSFASITDRNGVADNALDIMGTLIGADLGVSNINSSTLSFWMRSAPLILSYSRYISIYGTLNTGYNVGINGSGIAIESDVQTTTGSLNSTMYFAQNVDDNTWHHIAVRTTVNAINEIITIELFVDGAIVNLTSNTIDPVGTVINSFLTANATLKVSPLGLNSTSGDIDDIYFYKSALTDVEIAQIYNYTVPACTVNIPNANFKAYLVGNTAINTNGDTEIQCSEATSFTGEIDCYYLSITDMTGIESFSNLTILKCAANGIGVLDVTQNTALITLFCNHNSIASLDLTQNTNLKELRCGYNTLTNLNVDNNTGLTLLLCSANSISNLNLSQNLVLETLDCRSNLLTSLNLNQHTVLAALYAGYNSFTSLNVANGNNTNFTTFKASDNPNLTCIQVDDATYSTTNWTNIDATASFSANCTSTTGVQEFKSQLEIVVFPNPTNGLVTIKCTEKIQSIVIYNLTGQKVAQFQNTNTINISNLPNGIYTAKVIVGSSKPTMHKLVKE